ncbi:hypothetical protein NHH82_06120 [Oxalobacteraceae bacterium OTU3REALA1]|nr:hypothetical protein NHH82_06120 [Oxalobacteraceae bacterium OTU3REALA1]
MNVLGISEPHCDSSCALVSGGNLLLAVGEERFTRKKRHKGFPHKSIQWVLREAGLRLQDIDKIAVAKFSPYEDVGPYVNALRHHYSSQQPRASPWQLLLDRMIWQIGNVGYCYQASYRLNAEIARWARRNRIDDSQLVRVDHHSAHAYSAFYCSGFDSALVVTMDGQGAGICATVSEAREGNLKRVHAVALPNSVGQFYTLITLAAGFVMNRHEGKITGLAAAGELQQPVQDFVDGLIEFRDGTICSHAIFGNFFKLRSLMTQHRLEDVCYSFQARLEQVVLQYVAYYLRRSTGLKNLALGGGVFANVRLNQKLAGLPGIGDLFVYPNMGDGGSCVGAAYMVQPPAHPKVLRNLFLGPSFSQQQVVRELRRVGIPYTIPSDLPRAVAEILAQGKAVGRFSGAMEFGPRALGNRSILMSANDSRATYRLNRLLSRSDFMPFAPATMTKLATSCYLVGTNVGVPLEMMTISVDCTDWMKRACPAAVHVDGTARPQLVPPGSEYHDILEHYFELTGRPALINTSFNVHEEPIVCSPQDAIRTYVTSGLDALAIEGLLVARR